MDLHLPQNKILLKNCIVVKLQQLKLTKKELLLENEDKDEIENEISYYENLYQVLKNDDTDTLLSILKDAKKYGTFNQHILLTPAKEIAQEYIDLAKSLLTKHGISEENFPELKSAFYKGNENLIQSDKTKNWDELEEEHTPEPSQYLTEDIQKILADLNQLFKQSNPKAMTALQFKDFSSQFKELTKALGIQKLQQSFNSLGQTILDMQISFESNTKPVYKVDLTLSNKTHKILTERATASGFISADISNYIQNLCSTYLEANHYSNINEELLDATTINNQMHTFSKYYKKLEEMSNCKLHILSNNTIGVSSKAAYEPSKDLDNLDMIQEI